MLAREFFAVLNQVSNLSNKRNSPKLRLIFIKDLLAMKNRIKVAKVKQKKVDRKVVWGS